MPQTRISRGAGVSIPLERSLGRRPRRREGKRTRQAPTCKAERAEDKLGAVQDGEAALFLLADCFRALEILGALPWPDLLYLHDVH